MQEVVGLYFDEEGAGNTDVTLQAAIRRAQALNIRFLVVASTEGPTGLRAAELVAEAGYTGRLVVVTHQSGWRAPGEKRLSDETRRALEEQGAVVVMATHTLSGVERAFRDKYGGIDTQEIIADTLRLFSQGVKVGVECVMMAADAGVIPVDEDVVVVGGTSRGADTALVIRPANGRRFFDLKIREVVCMPR